MRGPANTGSRVTQPPLHQELQATRLPLQQIPTHRKPLMMNVNKRRPAVIRLRRAHSATDRQLL
jgi:hypothetical protein